VIVESPTKVKTIAGYLGDGYIVESSRGHVRDLPTGAAEVPAKYKGEKWARTGIDVDHGFEPIYVVSPDKKATMRTLKDALVGADELLLATDDDREGEAIAWHLLQELKPKVPVRRMVFHEITAKAIAEAVANPRELDTDKVDAQETRRILDRLYGYEVSPVLWKKVMPRLSAGRVQSVATRLVVDRERERIAFRSASYWDLDAVLDAGVEAEPPTFSARLTRIGERRVAQGRDFDSRGAIVARPGEQLVHLDEPQARALTASLQSAGFVVESTESKPYTRKPYAPFRTTTMQQEAGRKLGFTAQRAMSVAQDLYEGGFITYMRTDSVTLSETAITAARLQVTQLFGADYLPTKPRLYAVKAKGAQEAHEAIRPAGETFATPAQTGLRGDQFRLYELIWMRTIASQMKDAEGLSTTVRILATPAAGDDCLFVASGRTITFHGFLKAYVESLDDTESQSDRGDGSAAADDTQTRLPRLSEGQSLRPDSVTASGHETRPAARYTEPSLVAKLEELGIGRPSTYASIIRTITSRDYVFKKGSALVPTWLAFAVTRLLEEHFPKLVDYAFTAEMEEVLDQIAGGNAARLGVLTNFYFGAPETDGVAPEGNEGLQRLVSELGDIDARALSTFPLGDLETASASVANGPSTGSGPSTRSGPSTGSGIVVRVGRYGTYVEDDEGRRANVAEDLPPDELTVEHALELLSKPVGEERELGLDPETHRMIVARNGRFGSYVSEVLADDAPKSAKARTGSLFQSMSLDTVTLEQALALMSLPRVVGVDAEGAEVTAQNGRYGPYLKKGTDSRSLTAEEQIFDITLAEAEAIYAQPKQRGRAAAKPPLKELGADPVSGNPMVIKDGRFGAYVTDGEFNATLRRDDEIETITAERAAELLAEKRAKSPAPKKTPVRKAPAKKAAAKKVGSSAKKTATTKAPAKAG